jgi:2-polyprenyl-3-methyl-5-hydroxy-6-metoxy-1,4-benzoquinol methylase
MSLQKYRGLKIKSPKRKGFVPTPPLVYEAVLERIAKLLPKPGDSAHLDIGAGNGLLLRLVQERFGFEQRACDYTDEFIKYSAVPVDPVNLDEQKLPYPDSRFDLVTCLETIEHLENFRALLREIYRVLKPGGVAILTTPNILNLRSRLRFLTFGFHSLFGPLHVRQQENFDTRGHISPVSWFYLGHALLQSGFCDLSVSVDRLQRRSFLSLALLYLPIRFMGAVNLALERRGNIASLDRQNESVVKDINRIDILLGRTLVISARKAPGG